MNIETYFEQVRDFISNENFHELKNLSLEKPEYFNWVKEIFEPQIVNQQPNDVALIWKNDLEISRFSFQDISEKANQVLNFLRKKGINKGAILYVQLPLLAENWLTYIAAIKGGFIIVPAATTLASRDIEFRFKTLLPNVVIADAANAEKIDEAELNLPQKIGLKIIIGSEKPGWISWHHIESEAKNAEASETKSDDPLFYFFTSGTTGMPKVVIHTQFSYPFGHLSTASWIGFKKGDIHYNISQPGWAKFSWSSFFAPWNMGVTIFANQVSRFDPIDQLETIEKVGVTTFCAPPTVLRMFILEDLVSYHFKIRQCVAAGEPLNPEIIEKWKAGTGLTIRDGFGQTESTLMLGNLPNESIKYGSMGKPTFLYDVIIADDDGQVLPNLEEGNICVVTKNTNGLFLAYKDEPDKTQKVFRNGVYFTGDKAYKDEDGFVWFVGRDDDVIKASDYRVGPFEVESILLEHDAVIEAAVVASPHELRGFAIKAFIILNKNEKPTKKLADDIFEFAQLHLATYKLPRIIEFIDELPKTISGKIRRVELRNQEVTNKNARLDKPNEHFHSKY